MSIKATLWVNSLRLPSSEKLVLLALADYANNEDFRAWPSQDSICDWTQLSRRTVQVTLQALVERGVIERQRRRYDVVFTLAADPSRSAVVAHLARSATTAHLEATRSAATAHLEVNSEVPDAQILRRDAQNPTSRCAATAPNPIKEPIKEPERKNHPLNPLVDNSPPPIATRPQRNGPEPEASKPAQEKQAVPGDAEILEAWGRFKDAYPESMGPGARRRFFEYVRGSSWAPPVPAETIIDGALAYRRKYADPKLRKRPKAGTEWLRLEKWRVWPDDYPGIAPTVETPVQQQQADARPPKAAPTAEDLAKVRAAVSSLTKAFKPTFKGAGL